jgi:predicted 2-oxoglutarate/Fe(II)-dependent dioxygenase YbiX
LQSKKRNNRPLAPSLETDQLSDPDWLTDEVFVVAEFLSAEECARYIEMSESFGYEDALVTTPSGQVLRTDVRNNERVIFDDHELAKLLWKRIEDFAPNNIDGYRAIGVNERFRFYRYDPDQQFDWHQDGPFERDNGECSFWTFMIYLNEGFEGGETSFEDSCSDEPFDDFQVTPERGMALFFVHSIHHKGEPVLQGRKYVLRTDVMFAPRKRQRARRRRYS